MILGMSTSTYTLVHVLISFLGIGSGLAVIYGMLRGRQHNAIVSLFIVTTALTSLTGFAFPNEHITPGIVIGILSLIVLAGTIVARYVMHMRGPWRAIYVITAAIALYFNCFVLIAQSFEKVPALHVLAPNGKEPPFAIAQLCLLVLFIALTVMAVKRFHVESRSVSTLSGSARQKGAA
jgi:hypothetical protein